MTIRELYEYANANGFENLPLFAYLVYIGFFCNECDECKKKWRKGNG